MVFNIKSVLLYNFIMLLLIETLLIKLIQIIYFLILTVFRNSLSSTFLLFMETIYLFYYIEVLYLKFLINKMSFITSIKCKRTIHPRRLIYVLKRN